MLQHKLSLVRRLLDQIVRVVRRAVVRHHALQERVIVGSGVHRFLVQQPDNVTVCLTVQSFDDHHGLVIRVCVSGTDGTNSWTRQVKYLFF